MTQRAQPSHTPNTASSPPSSQTSHTRHRLHAPSASSPKLAIFQRQEAVLHHHPRRPLRESVVPSSTNSPDQPIASNRGRSFRHSCFAPSHFDGCSFHPKLTSQTEYKYSSFAQISFFSFLFRIISCNPDQSKKPYLARLAYALMATLGVRGGWWCAVLTEAVCPFFLYHF